MDENGPVQVNYRNFALPLCLLSLGFFMSYTVILSGILVFVLRLYLPGGAFFSLPLVFLFISFIGSILVFREMKEQSLPWKDAIPLCILSGAVVLSTVPFVFPQVTGIGIYSVFMTLAGFMCLPAGVAYLLRGLQGTDFTAARSFAQATGFFGLAMSGLLLVITIAGSWLGDPGLVSPVIFLLCLFHILVLMPVLGVKLFIPGLGFSKTAPAAIETGGPAGPLPPRKISEGIRDIPKSVSPRAKRTILIMVVLGLVIAGYSVYVDITDTTPGRKWTQTTPEAPFGDTEGFASTDYKGKFWLIGGTRHSGPYGEAWYTSDGITWNRESSADMVPQHLGASSAVFRDALWIIGGADEITQTHGNEIWFSGNGITWSEMQPKSVFPPRAWHSTVVFRDRIWVIGGRDSTGYRNDIWYSDDGVSWVQAKPAAEFSPRSDQASFVYRDKIWMIGGRDRTGDLTDVWNSDDGGNWTQVAVPAAFERGNPVSAVTFDGRIWVIQIPHTWGIVSPWATARPSGIWYSYDGIAWTKVDSSPEFFSNRYAGGEPFLIVFQNRLYVLQRYNGSTGIWYTMPQGQVS